MGGAYRGMGTSWTLNARVVLTGPDPVPQLPVNVDGFRSNRLHAKKQLAFMKRRKTREQQQLKKESVVPNPCLLVF